MSTFEQTSGSGPQQIQFPVYGYLTIVMSKL